MELLRRSSAVAQDVCAVTLTASTASIAINNKTVTGRLGYARDRVLLYGKGSGARVGSNSPMVVTILVIR